jgi:hypothetical protein
MPLILAIEPDRRQASQLTAMVRGRLHAELVLGESAERALAALGQRVPDLILTSALLSPKDENALGERLRALDGAAAHVQTLTIPVLASAAGRGASRAGGVLSALRRDKGKATAAHEGCDPAVFAEQCKEYLERAETERAALAEQAATAALDAQVEATARHADAPPSVVRPASGRDSKKARAGEPQSVVLSPNESVEPVETYREPVPETTDPYVATAKETVVASRLEEPAPEPAGKRKAQKSSKRHQPQGIRSVLGLTQSDSDGPASLVAAVAALEAEEHVEPIIAPIVDAPQTFDQPSVVTPVADAPIVAAHSFDPFVSYTPSFETSVIRPPVFESPQAPGHTEDLLDLSSLLDGPSSAPARHAGPFGEEPVVEVYELDNSLLTTSFDEAVQPLTTSSDPFSTTSVINSSPRAEGRSWPVLDTLIAETAAFQSAAPANVSSPSGLSGSSGFTGPFASPASPVREEAKPLGDILEALRRDAEQLPAAPSAPPAPESSTFATSETVARPEAVSLSDIDLTAQEPPPADEAENGADKKKKKRSKASPAQDEWGFFDPDQCGFAALIEKLEEITDKDDTPTPRRA